MFRSRSRKVVYPQAEHARLAARLAAAWGNDEVPRPALPFDAFVRGVEEHDRGYGELDEDGIGEVPLPRWLEIQRRSFEPRGEDAVVDLVVALHVRRLVSWQDAPEAQRVQAEMSAALLALRAEAGIDPRVAAEADEITDLCDRVAFDFCFEEPASGRVGAFAYAVDGEGTIALDPWPFGAPRLEGAIVAFRAEGYPATLEPLAQPFRVEPGRV
jgi:hypothetical protein